jgi:hypothetical protein
LSKKTVSTTVPVLLQIFGVLRLTCFVIISAASVIDPGNTIKRDLYDVCEQFETAETVCRSLQRLKEQPAALPADNGDYLEQAINTDNNSSLVNDLTTENPNEDDDETSDFSISKTNSSLRDIASSGSNVDPASCVTEHEEGSGGGGLERGSTDRTRTEGNSEDTCYSSSALNSEEASLGSLPTSQNASAAGHYEECTISSTVVLNRRPSSLQRKVTATEKSEIFITMAAVVPSCGRGREPS